MQKIPACVGIILDGNRRWAVEHNLPKMEGHRRGLNTLVDCTKWARDLGVQHLAVFAFSTENWQREAAEVSYLMGLFREMAQKRMEELKKERVRVRVAGQIERFSPDLQESMRTLERETAGNSGITLWLCMSYGGRAEIAAAAAAAAGAGEAITEGAIEKHLWTADMPDPDIIIRTSGEQRLSGFLTWKSVYSELFFIDTKWPDFTEETLKKVLDEYATRDRRKGR